MILSNEFSNGSHTVDQLIAADTWLITHVDVFMHTHTHAHMHTHTHLYILSFLSQRFILKLRILPKSPQHLCSRDKFSYLYLYEQVGHVTDT